MDETEQHVMPTYARAAEVFVAGRGATVVDRDGREFLDFLAGIAVSALGHAHPELSAAVADQIGRVAHLSNLFRHPFSEQVAARLCAHTAMDAVFFTNSGTESMECALKLARRAMGRRGTPARTSFVALEGGFHGRTLGALSLTHAEKYRVPFGPLLDVAWVPPGDLAALERCLHERLPAALVIEPIQGEGGVRELPGDYLRGARELCDRTGTILVHDEIQSGCGRTGHFLAAQHHDVTPDVVTIAKPIAAGLPMGACLARGELAHVFDKGDHGSTFAGGPLVCRAALVFLDALDGGLLDNVAARGAELRAGLERLAAELPVIAEVRGRGLMLGLRLHHSAALAQRRLYDAGLIVNCTAGDVLRLLPPFVVSSAQIDTALGQLRSVLTGLPANQETA
ncbi:MAG: acetylornithine transaminase [Planctomycetes bacterium]|nr:acetylornithine transaminase [Planctomycetota bacterium]